MTSHETMKMRVSLTHTHLMLVIAAMNVSHTLKAQTVHQFNSWWYYSGTYQIKETWTAKLLYSWSRHDFVADWQISKLGLSADKSLTRGFSMGASYEWAIIFPYGRLPVPEKRREHRLLERFSFREKVQRTSLSSILELEQFFRNGDFLQRIRVRFGIRFPLIINDKSDQVFGMSFFNQVFINHGDGSPAIGQNRYYGGFDIRLSKGFTLALGYLNQRIIIRPELIENDHTLMIGLFHRANISKLFNNKQL